MITKTLNLTQSMIPNAEQYISDFVKNLDVTGCVPLTYITNNQEMYYKLVFIVKDDIKR